MTILRGVNSFEVERPLGARRTQWSGAKLFVREASLLLCELARGARFELCFDVTAHMRPPVPAREVAMHNAEAEVQQLFVRHGNELLALRGWDEDASEVIVVAVQDGAVASSNLELGGVLGGDLSAFCLLICDSC